MSIALRWQHVAAVVSLLALLTLIVSGTETASADEFTTQNNAPSISSVTVPASIQPDEGASDTVYSVVVGAGDADTLNDLSEVAVCLYRTTGGDSTCASPDPTNTVKLTWTPGGSFAIDDGSLNEYWALGAGADASVEPTLTNTAGDFTLKFSVSEATREGGWTAAVTVTDSSAATATDSTQTTTVAHYSAITTRVSADFGTIGAGLASAGEVTSSPTVTANGQTTYSMTAGDFTDGGDYTFTLKTDGATSTAPAAGEVTFDCEVASTFTEASATRVGSTSTQLSASETPTGTPEDGTAVDNTCRLAHGGGRPTTTYSFTVVNAVGNG